MPVEAWAPYCGPGSTPGDAWSRWNLDPVLIAILAGAVLAGWWLTRSRAPADRAAWFAGVAVLAVVFVSPICALASALFSVRTVHHLALVAVAAPLLARLVPPQTRWLAAATAVQAAVFWTWHAPGAYAWALSDDVAYWMMQLSLLGSATLFWASLRGARAPTAILALLVTTVQMGLLGALIAFAAQPLYAPHLLTTWAWGLSPLDDQIAAGLIMWAPALGLYLAAALVRLHRLTAPEAPAAR